VARLPLISTFLTAGMLLLGASSVLAQDAKTAKGTTKGGEPASMMRNTQVTAEQAAPAVVKATKQERTAALRLEPLARAAFFNREFEIDPTDVEAGLVLSDTLRVLGRNSEAAEAAHRVLLFAPDNYDALLAAARAHIADNNAFYAIDPLQSAVARKPGDWRAWSLLGVALDETKRGSEAQAMWDKALSLSPDNPSVLTNKALYLASSGDLAGAETILRRAVAQPGAGIQVRQNLALILGLQGKMPEAEKLLRQDLPPDVADKNLAWLQASLKPADGGGNRSWDSLKGDSLKGQAGG